MIAQSRRPALGYRVRATEQAGVCTDARETTRPARSMRVKGAAIFR